MHDGVIIHLESDILECEVKWAFEIINTNKASGGDGIPVELFQILALQLTRYANLSKFAKPLCIFQRIIVKSKWINTYKPLKTFKNH